MTHAGIRPLTCIRVFTDNSTDRKVQSFGVKEEQIMKKRWLSGFMLVMMLVSLVGCGASKNTEDKSQTAAAGSESGSGALPAKIVAGYLPDYEPFVYQDANGEPAGYDVAVTKEACSRLGIEVEFEAIPWESLLPSLDSERIDIAATQIYRTDERAQTYYFSTYPYMETTFNAIIRSDLPESTVDAVLEDGLKFNTVAGQAQETYCKELGVEFNYIEGTPQNQIDDILNGRTDGMVQMWITIDDILQSRGQGDALKCVGDPVSSDYVYAVFHKNEEGKALAEAFGEVYLEMYQDGTLKKICEECFEGQDYITDTGLEEKQVSNQE